MIKRFVDGLYRRPIVQKALTQAKKTPYMALFAAAVILTLMIISGIGTVRQALAARAPKPQQDFPADRVVVQRRKAIKDELQTKVAEARQTKAEQQKQAAISAAKLLEAQKQSRLIAFNRQQSTKRVTRSVDSANYSGGVTKTGTAFTPDKNENGGFSTTATGEDLTELLDRGEKVVASNDYKLGTKLKITVNGKPEWYTVKDRMGRGGKVDFLVRTKAEASKYGRQTIKIEDVKAPGQK